MTGLFSDTCLLLQANLRAVRRRPVWALVGLFQPICYLLLFGPLLGPLAGLPGFPRGDAWTVFTPGVLIMTAVASSAFNGLGLLASVRAGVIERLRVTPVSRLALLLGLVARDVLVLLGQATLLLGAGVALGLRPNPAGLLLLVPLLVLVGVLLASCSYGLALVLRDENSLASTLNLVVLPLILLSGITLPLTLAPRLLRRIADANPLAYAVDAARALSGGTLADHRVAQAFVLFVVLAGVALGWASHLLRRAIA
jgi:ABC-2 type transport system permease protein